MENLHLHVPEWQTLYTTGSVQHVFIYNTITMLTSPAEVVAKYCDEYVCLAARISPEPHMQSLSNFLCMLPMSMASSSSVTLPTVGKGVTGVHSAGEVWSMIALLSVVVHFYAFVLDIITDIFGPYSLTWNHYIKFFAISFAVSKTGNFFFSLLSDGFFFCKYVT